MQRSANSISDIRDTYNIATRAVVTEDNGLDQAGMCKAIQGIDKINIDY